MYNPSLSPYLNFPGTCEEAMTFYQSVLGGKLTFSRFGENPMPVSEAWKNKIMHVTLENEGLSFMASDTFEGAEIINGNSVHMSIAGTDSEKLTKMFEGLSQGGQVVMPLTKASWGDTFGMFVDKYGIHWMFNISAK